MAIKSRQKVAEQAGLLADELADKAYGEKLPSDVIEDEEFIVTSISIQRSMLHQLEDLAFRNKRRMSGPKTISALIRKAVSSLLVNN